MCWVFLLELHYFICGLGFDLEQWLRLKTVMFQWIKSLFHQSRCGSIFVLRRVRKQVCSEFVLATQRFLTGRSHDDTSHIKCPTLFLDRRMVQRGKVAKNCTAVRTRKPARYQVKRAAEVWVVKRSNYLILPTSEVWMKGPKSILFFRFDVPVVFLSLHYYL